MKISKRAQIYLYSSRLFGHLPETPRFFSGIAWRLKSVGQAVWLGLLDATTLNEITWFCYNTGSGFESEDFNINQGLWSWEVDAIREHFINKKHVLVAGAGGGREVIALARLGYEVTAFDFSSSLTNACHRNLEKAGYSARILDSPPDGVPEGLDVYDALLIGRGFYHHIPGRSRRVAFLGRCHKHLIIGSPVIVSDFFTRLDGSKFHLQTQAVANLFRRLGNLDEPAELGDWLTNCMQHAFARDEIEQELLEAGIKPEIYRVSPFSEDSHLAHILGRVV